MIQITSKWFCAGVIFDSTGHAHLCAPILNYMKGWTLIKVMRYARIRKWDVHTL